MWAKFRGTPLRSIPQATAAIAGCGGRRPLNRVQQVIMIILIIRTTLLLFFFFFFLLLLLCPSDVTLQVGFPPYEDGHLKTSSRQEFHSAVAAGSTASDPGFHTPSQSRKSHKYRIDQCTKEGNLGQCPGDLAVVGGKGRRRPSRFCLCFSSGVRFTFPPPRVCFQRIHGVIESRGLRAAVRRSQTPHTSRAPRCRPGRRSEPGVSVRGVVGGRRVSASRRRLRGRPKGARRSPPTRRRRADPVEARPLRSVGIRGARAPRDPPRKQESP